MSEPVGKAVERRAARAAKPTRKVRSKAARATRSDEVAACQDVIDTALEMSRTGLSPGRSGNVSRRWGDGMLITPSGIAYDVLKPSDIVAVTEAGTWPEAGCQPSSEWRFHLAAYQVRPDVSAIVHTHSKHATALACAREPIPAFHYMVAVAGGRDIPCVPYATFGTEQLAAHVAEGLKSRNACLMANHGQIAIGSTLGDALALAGEVEILAEQYLGLLQLGRIYVHILDDAEMDRVLERFRSYGQSAQK